MGTVEVLTKARMEAIEAASIIDGDVDAGGHLLLKTYGGTTIDAGNVKGADGQDADPSVVTVTDSTTIDFTKTGAGTPASPWNITGDVKDLRTAEEKTTHVLKILDASTRRWYTTGADGATYGPFRIGDGWIPKPGDEVWLNKDSNGVFTIAGAKATTKSLYSVLASTTYSYAQGWNTMDWEEPSYTIRNGIVQLNGLFATSDATAYSKVLMTLPPEARPDTQLILLVDHGSAGRALYVKPNGDVVMEAGFTVSNYTSLSKIMFPVAGRATWTTIPSAWYINGWTDYYTIAAPEFGTARYWIDETGYVWWAGMIKGGTMGLAAFVLPVGHPALSDSRSGHVATASGGAFGFIYTPNTVNRQFIVGSGAGSNAWVSLAGVSYPTGAMISSMAWLTGSTTIGSPGGKDGILMGASWNNYEPSETNWSKFKIGQNAYGLVITRGLIQSGAFGGGNVMAFIKDEWSRKRSTILTTVSNQAFGRLDLAGQIKAAAGATYQNSLIPGAGSNVWFSMDGIKWFPE